MNDVEFERLLVSALAKAADRDYINIPDEAIVPPSPRHQRWMQRFIKNPQAHIKRQKRPLYVRALRTAAAVAVTISILFGAAMLHPEVRAIVADFIKTWLEDRVIYGVIDGSASNIPDTITLGYLPDGFDITLELSDSFGTVMIFESSGQQFIEIKALAEGSKLTLDNEHSDFYATFLNGDVIDVYESNTLGYSNTLVCHNEERNIFIIITGSIDVGELMEILESLEY